MRAWPLIALLLLSVEAMAQPGRNEAEPNQPPPTQPVPQSDPTGENLSEQLRRSDGVIRPPNNAPDMTAPVPRPQPNTTPVIPPPGTRGGGRPGVEPR